MFGKAGVRPGSRATFVSAKVAKTMLAVAWPFGFPVRFADSFGLAQDRSGGAQTRGACPEFSRRAQTVRTFFPLPAALLGLATRPFNSSHAPFSRDILHQPKKTKVGEPCELFSA